MLSGDASLQPNQRTHAFTQSAPQSNIISKLFESGSSRSLTPRLQNLGIPHSAISAPLSQQPDPDNKGKKALLTTRISRHFLSSEESRSNEPIPPRINLDSAPSAGQTRIIDRSTIMSRTRSASTPNGTATHPLATNNPFNPLTGLSNPTVSLQDTEDGSSTGIHGERPLLDATNASVSHLPSIHFIPAQEPLRGRPSLDFQRITRILPSNKSIIRVGRYSERDTSSDSNAKTPSDAPIGFKSKVVSRRHCEFSFENNQWFIKDVKSSSGTFLNHIRLSQPGIESKPFPVNDGDIVQLGIDFKGGEEMIFRCVKIRIETNRGWQKAVNKFNKSTHQQLQRLAKYSKDSDNASKHSTECTICLNSIAPCQALFVAPCSHTWHYRCIRKMLNDPKNSSQFLCPNCRAQADLDAEIEEPELEYLDEDDEFVDAQADMMPSASGSSHPYGENRGLSSNNHVLTNGTTRPETRNNNLGRDNNNDASAHLSFISLSPTRQLEPFTTETNTTSNPNSRLEPPPQSHSSLDRTQTLSIPSRTLDPTASAFVPGASTIQSNRSDNRQTIAVGSSIGQAAAGGVIWPPHIRNTTPPDTSGIVREGPITPRNTAGPFVFDGSGVTQDGETGGILSSLNGIAATRSSSSS